MGKVNNCLRCIRFCKLHCNGAFALRIFSMSILLIGVALQAIAVSPKTKWDTYETEIDVTIGSIHQTHVIEAYQTLYDVTVVKDATISAVPFIVPPIYPLEKKDYIIDWKEIIVTYETASEGLAALCILLAENALLIHFLIPESRFSKIFQPIILTVVILSSAGAGALSVFGALTYKQNYQQILMFNHKDRKMSNIMKQAYKALDSKHISYHPEDNKPSLGYYTAMAAGSLFCLSAVLHVVNLVIHVLWQRSKLQTAPTKSNEIIVEANGEIDVAEKKDVKKPKGPKKKDQNDVIVTDIK